jgi:hypothetical protein
MSEFSSPMTPDQQFAMHVENAIDGVGRGARILQPDIDAPLDPTPNEVYERTLTAVGRLFNRNLSRELPENNRSMTVDIDPTTAEGLGINTQGTPVTVLANLSIVDLFSRISYDTRPDGTTKIVRGGTFYIRDINFSYEDGPEERPRTTHKRLLNAGFMRNQVAEALNMKDQAYDQALIKETDPYLESIERIVASGQVGTTFLLQPHDAFSKSDEAIRDTVINRLSDRFNVPTLDEQLVTSEIHFPNEEGQLLTITASEAVSLGFQLADPNADQVAVKGIWRGLRIHATDTAHDITVIEIEIPVTYTDGVTHYRRMIKTTVSPREEV